MVIVVAIEDAPPRLRGRLSLWLVEVRSGVYVGSVTARLRDMIWDNVVAGCRRGSGVMVWPSSSRANCFRMRTTGENRRVPVQVDGLWFTALEPQTPPVDSPTTIGDSGEVSPWSAVY